MGPVVAGRAYRSIGEVLSMLRPEFADLTISKIRFLESQGLLDPERTPSGYRKFYEQDVERLRWILRQQREQYLPLKVIKGRLVGGPEVDGVPADPGGPPEAAPSGSPADAAEEPAGRPVPSPPSSTLTEGIPNPLALGRQGVSMSVEELSGAVALSTDDLADLERYGLITGRVVGGTTYYDEEALVVAKLAAAFMRFGVEARHLRMYKTAAEREAGFFEQLVMPMVKQRNPRARRQAMESLVELAKLGQSLRAAMLRQALKDHTSL